MVHTLSQNTSFYKNLNQHKLAFPIPQILMLSYFLYACMLFQFNCKVCYINVYFYFPLSLQIETLQHFEGDRGRLGTAEKFFIALTELPSYKVRIDAMVLKGDFSTQIGSIRPNVDTLSTACRRLYDNAPIKSFLRGVLHAGNFINKV